MEETEVPWIQEIYHDVEYAFKTIQHKIGLHQFSNPALNARLLRDLANYFADLEKTLDTAGKSQHASSAPAAKAAAGAG